MKPTNEAITEALSVTQIPEENMREYMRRVLTAAYAAQFQGKDYAGLVEELREDALQFDLKDTAYENTAKEAADTIETLLAKLNNKPKPSDDYAVLIERLRKNSVWGEVIEELAMVRAERDALAARLAPVDDEALVEIAAKAQWKHAWQDAGGTEEDAILISGDDWHQFIEPNRAAIAAIRSHIEAAERERCAKIAELHSYPMKTVAGTGYNNAAKEIAAAIRSGE